MPTALTLYKEDISYLILLNPPPLFKHIKSKATS